MKKMRVPLQAIKNKMEAAGLEPTFIDQDGSAVVSSGGAGAGAAAAAAASGTTFQDDPIYAQYFKMKKMRVPLPAIKSKMQAAGLDPDIIDKDGSDVVSSGGAGAGAGAAAAASGTKLKDDPTYGNFFKMKKLGMPVAIIKGKMENDNLDPNIIDRDGDDLAPAAPAAAAAPAAPAANFLADIGKRALRKVSQVMGIAGTESPPGAAAAAAAPPPPKPKTQAEQVAELVAKRRKKLEEQETKEKPVETKSDVLTAADIQERIDIINERLLALDELDKFVDSCTGNELRDAANLGNKKKELIKKIDDIQTALLKKFISPLSNMDQNEIKKIFQHIRNLISISAKGNFLKNLRTDPNTSMKGEIGKARKTLEDSKEREQRALGKLNGGYSSGDEDDFMDFVWSHRLSRAYGFVL